MQIFIGRQPIFNLQEQIVAYELLYRSGETNSFPDIDPDEATIRLLNNAFIAMEIEEVTNGRPAFVNFTNKVLFNELVEDLNVEQVVIEILEDVEITDQLVERVAELKEQGFLIALDDFVFQEEVTLYSTLFNYVDYIKVDFLNTSTVERMQIETVVKDKFPHISLLAEKVENYHQFEVAVKSGYTLFQGYFFQKPQVISAKDIPINVMQYLQVLALLREGEPNIDQLTEQIERDISLSYKLLRLINNSGKIKRRKVRTIKQAILMFGLTDLRRWIYVVTMKDLDKQNRPDVFNELFKQSLYRAKVCDIVARYQRLDNYSEYFLIGLFSLIDTILSRSMDNILQHMPLSEDIVMTLLGADTKMSPFLDFSIALANANFEDAIQLGETLQLTSTDVLEISNQAEQWVKETFDSYNVN